MKHIETWFNEKVKEEAMERISAEELDRWAYREEPDSPYTSSAFKDAAYTIRSLESENARLKDEVEIEKGHAISANLAMLSGARRFGAMEAERDILRQENARLREAAKRFVVAAKTGNHQPEASKDVCDAFDALELLVDPPKEGSDEQKG
jgi:hypothetical protein